CFVCSSFSEPIEIIEHSAGIYFDPTSIVYFQTDNWNKLNNNEILLNRQIEKLNYIFASSSRTNNKILNLEKINSMFNIIEGSSLLSISNVLDTVLNSILFAKANILHPYVISPKKLYNELSNNSQLKRTNEFPVSLTLQNIHTIIDLSKLTVYYYNNKLMFIIQVPLMSPIKFNLYKNLPLPTPNKLTLKCNNNITDYNILHGTGILYLENNCVAYFQTLQFHPSNVYKSTVLSQITLSFDLTLDDCCKYNILNESTHSINPISLSNIDLESLKLASHELENLETEIRNSKNQSLIVKYGNYYSGLTYIYNQCYNTKQMKKHNNVHSSIELTEISDDLENDNKSVKSLPNID
ncbi:hypothetical protein HW555_003936, partial [Spodoptera exigua]